MKRAWLLCLLLGLRASVWAQSPVSWKYEAVKVGDKTFEVRLTATIKAGWHLYSQTTPDGGPIPTKISFNKNPLLDLDSAVKEVGRLVSKHEEVFDITTKYFADRVEFVQRIKLKSKAKTNITGTVEFMVCNDTQCLPPATVNFSVGLNGK